MAEMRVSNGALSETIDLYWKLLKDASKVEVELKAGGRKVLEPEKKEKILAALTQATAALADGCQQGSYGLFLSSGPQDT